MRFENRSNYPVVITIGAHSKGIKSKKADVFPDDCTFKIKSENGFEVNILSGKPVTYKFDGKQMTWSWDGHALTSNSAPEATVISQAVNDGVNENKHCCSCW